MSIPRPADDPADFGADPIANADLLSALKIGLEDIAAGRISDRTIRDFIRDAKTNSKTPE